MSFIANVAGVIEIKFMPVKSSPIISDVSLTLAPSELFNNIKITTDEFLKITGLKFVSYGFKYLPLFFISVFFFMVVIFALIRIIGIKDGSQKGGFVIISAISVLGVYAVGVLMFRVRAIYFFIWYFLVAFSFLYLTDFLTGKKKNIICIMLLACGAVNFAINFGSDIIGFKPREEFFEEVTEELVSEGTKYIFHDIHVTPFFAVYSDDKIFSGSVILDLEKETGNLMNPVQYLQPVDVFYTAELDNSCFILSNWTLDYLNKEASKEYIEELFSCLEFVKKRTFGEETFYFYNFNTKLINPEYSNFK